MTRTYSITTAHRDFSTTNARKAASVAASWKRQGLDPQAQVIFGNNGPVTFSEPVAIRSIAKTAADLSAAMPR